MEYTEIHKDWYHRDCKDTCYWNLSKKVCKKVSKKAFYYDPLFLMSDRALREKMEKHFTWMK